MTHSSSVEMVAASPRSRELFRMPSIEQQLPLKFPNKTFEVVSFKAYCNGCNNELPPDLFRGIINLDVENMAVLEAVGACHHCNCFTRFNYRVYDNGQVDFMHKDGRWHRRKITQSQHKSRLTWGQRLLVAALVAASVVLFPLYAVSSYFGWAVLRMTGFSIDKDTQ